MTARAMAPRMPTCDELLLELHGLLGCGVSIATEPRLSAHVHWRAGDEPQCVSGGSLIEALSNAVRLARAQRDGEVE